MIDNTHKDYLNISEKQQDSSSSEDNSLFLKGVVNRCKYNGYEINLKQIRQAKGLTQSDLARQTGYTSNFINMIERGKLIPILETKIKIAQALGCDTSAIWIKEVDK